MTIWRMPCLVASEAVREYMHQVLPEAEVARRYQRFLSWRRRPLFWIQPSSLQRSPRCRSMTWSSAGFQKQISTVS